MKFMGSKNRIAMEILPIILKERKEEQYYVEPFCGGLGTMDKVYGKRIASDKNKYLIAMWKGLQEGKTRPKGISRELYCQAREEYNEGVNRKFSDFMIGWIGWMGSYNGRFFDGGYSGKSSGRDYIDEQIRNTEKQIEKLRGIIFNVGVYDEIDYPEGCLIYCDIPYKDTKQYSTSKGFNHEKFWQWVREMTRAGHQVFVSEYNAPSDFECVWEKQITNAMNNKNTYKPIEKLFVFHEQNEINSQQIKKDDNLMGKSSGDTKIESGSKNHLKDFQSDNQSADKLFANQKQDEVKKDE